MRTFISIDIPKDVREEIGKIQSQLPEFYGKKTELENLHLTLKFLGEVDEDKVEEVRRRLRGIEYKRFETEIKYLGFFDNVKQGKRYGPVWLHLSDCEGLQKKIDDSLEGLFEKEKRFMSHLTIARIKTLENKKEFLEDLGEIKIQKIKFVVGNFRLKQSILWEKGPRYGDIENYDLI